MQATSAQISAPRGTRLRSCAYREADWDGDRRRGACFRAACFLTTRARRSNDLAPEAREDGARRGLIWPGALRDLPLLIEAPWRSHARRELSACPPAPVTGTRSKCRGPRGRAPDAALSTTLRTARSDRLDAG